MHSLCLCCLLLFTVFVCLLFVLFCFLFLFCLVSLVCVPDSPSSVVNKQLGSMTLDEQQGASTLVFFSFFVCFSLISFSFLFVSFFVL